MTDRRPLLAALLATALTLGAAPDAWAQGFPSKPLKLVVNFPPGGAADVIGRALAAQLTESLGQQVVVENKPGANGNIGADAVAKSPADGYTLLMSSGGAMTVNPFIYPKMPFDPERDLVPVASVAKVLVFFAVHPSLPVGNLAEFIAYAKANPGKLSYGSPGTGSSPHLAAEMFRRQAGFQATHVPYKGAAPALTDLLAGQLQFMFDPGPGLRHAREGKLKILAVGSPKRSSQLPDTPTLGEAMAGVGGVGGGSAFDADTTFGIYAPGGTPAAVVAQLHEAVNKGLGSAKVQEVIRTLAAEPAPASRADFMAAQQRDRERFGAFIRDAGIKAE